MFLFLAIFFAVFFFLLRWEAKFTKQDLKEIYGVDHRTMKKWVHHLCPAFLVKGWDDPRKKMTALEFHALLFIFGDPEDTPVMKKGDIAGKCDSNTRTLKGVVMKNLEKLGLTEEAYKMTFFPPFMGARLVACM